MARPTRTGASGPPTPFPAPGASPCATSTLDGAPRPSPPCGSRPRARARPRSRCRSPKPLCSSSLLAPAGDWTADFFAWQRKVTGSDGKATWQLAAGEYRFRLESGEDGHFPFPDPEQAEEKPRVVPIVWTEEGPLVREIRL